MLVMENFNLILKVMENVLSIGYFFKSNIFIIKSDICVVLWEFYF